MKRYLALLLVFAMLLPLAGCGKEKGSALTPDSGDTTVTAAPVETPEVTEAPTPEPTQEPTPEPTPVPTPEPTPEPTPTPVSYLKVKTSGGALYIRETGSANGKKLGSLPNGTVVELVEAAGDWTKIKAGSLTGFASSKFLTATTETPGPIPSNTPKPADSTSCTAWVKLTNTGANLNLRKGPGTDKPIVTTLKHGTKVSVLSEEGEWVKIKAGNNTGYVQKRFLTKTEVKTSATPKPSASATPTPAPTQTPKYTASVKLNDPNSRLNVRQGASADTPVVTTVKHGDKVGVLSEANNWAKIQVGSKVGYIPSRYLSTTEVTPAPTQTPSGTPTPAPTQTGDATGKTGTVDTDKLIMRKGAGTTYDPIKTLTKGTKVTVLGTKGNWYKIKAGDTEGYVYKTYLKVG